MRTRVSARQEYAPISGAWQAQSGGRTVDPLEETDPPPALVALLNESFRLWQVDARAEGDGARHLAAAIHAPGAPPMALSRCSAGRRGLPSWRLELGAGESVALASLPAVLHRLRLALDPRYAPRRAIVGVRPREPGREDSCP